MRASLPVLLLVAVAADASPPSPRATAKPLPPPAPVELAVGLSLPRSGFGVMDPGEVRALVLDRVTVTREVRLRAPTVVFAKPVGTSPLRVVDVVEVWVAYVAVGQSAEWPPRLTLYTERSFTTRNPLVPMGPGSGFYAQPGRTAWLRHQAWVPVGTKALVLEPSHGTSWVRVELATGDAEVLDSDGSVQASAPGRRLSGVAVGEPRYQRLRVSERLPGVSMIQAEPCVRYFDLAVDDVYVVRGVAGPTGVVRDQLILDATFLQRADVSASHPHCHTHVSETGQYAFVARPDGITLPGEPPDARIETFGARSLRRFDVDPGTQAVLLGFGDPQAPADVLRVDLALGAVTVAKRSGALRNPGSRVRDLSPEWLARGDNPRRYWLRKFSRGRLMRTDLDASMTDAAACRELEGAIGTTYQPVGEAEPLRETWELACNPRNQ